VLSILLQTKDTVHYNQRCQVNTLVCMCDNTALWHSFNGHVQGQPGLACTPECRHSGIYWS